MKLEEKTVGKRSSVEFSNKLVKENIFSYKNGTEKKIKKILWVLRGNLVLMIKWNLSSALRLDTSTGFVCLNPISWKVVSREIFG